MASSLVCLLASLCFTRKTEMGLCASKCCEELEVDCCKREQREPDFSLKDHRICSTNCFGWFAVSVEPVIHP